MNYKNRLFLLNAILLSSSLVLAMENKSDLTKPKLKIDYTNINWGAYFKKLPKEIIKEILDYIFSDFNINNLNKSDSNFDKLIEIIELKKINKAFAQFIIINYSDQLKNISEALGKKLLKITKTSSVLITKEDIELAKKLIKAGANIYLRDKEYDQGNSALHLSCDINKIDIAIELINAKININLKNKRKRTPLIMASIHENKNLIIELIKARASINIQDSYDFTALMISSKDGYKDIVSELINEGADPNIKNPQFGNKNALEFAKTDAIKDIIKKATKVEKIKKNECNLM